MAQCKAEDRKRVFALVHEQELEQQRLAPGFLDWRKAEDKRIKHHKTMGDLKSKVKELHAIWQLAEFKPGPERENYMDAMKALGEYINDTSPHTP
jgi:hypothetical protein